MRTSQNLTRPLLALLMSAILMMGLTLLMTPASPVSAAPQTGIIHVDSAATGEQNGRSWANAFTNLQDALASANVADEIWVAAGIYYPDRGSNQTLGNRAATFRLFNGVAIYGGFAGTETERDARDWTVNVTVLSGDIDGNDTVDANGVVTDAANIVGENSYHVVNSSNTTASTILDGFIITGGLANADALPRNQGGGILNEGGSPTLRNLLIQGNQASATGGGLHSMQGDPSLMHVTFVGNSAVYGGGFFNVIGDPRLAQVQFRGNRAAEEGGGLSTDNSSTSLLNVTFAGNSSAGIGGALYVANAGVVLTNVVVLGNHAGQGGGLYHRNADVTVTNGTISGNRADEGGGVFNQDSTVTIQNSIVWNNQAEHTLPDLFSAGGDVTIRSSMVQGCNPDGVWAAACGEDGGDNLADGDPRFVTPADLASAPSAGGDLRLQADSPAIDAGNNDYVAGVGTDLNGSPRIANGTVDLGAYEFGAPSPLGYIYLPAVLK